MARLGCDPGVSGGGPQTLPGLGGFKVALDAIEGCTGSGPVSLAGMASAWSR
jgi:hypothetical protein